KHRDGGSRRDGGSASGGRRPRTALPTRTCVAPARIAASRSSLIPAEIHVAPGYADVTLDDTDARVAKHSAGSASSGATAITPRSSSDSDAATEEANGSTSPAAAPPREASPSGRTWTSTPSRRPSPSAAR